MALVLKRAIIGAAFLRKTTPRLLLHSFYPAIKRNVNGAISANYLHKRLFLSLKMIYGSDKEEMFLNSRLADPIDPDLNKTPDPDPTFAKSIK